MMHVTYANKSFFVDDEVAGLLAEYAAVLAAHDLSDTVDVLVLGTDGNEVTATLVLNANTDLVIETTNSGVELPRNDAATSAIRAALDRIASPPEPQPETRIAGARYVDDL